MYAFFIEHPRSVTVGYNKDSSSGTVGSDKETGLHGVIFFSSFIRDRQSYEKDTSPTHPAKQMNFHRPKSV